MPAESPRIAELRRRVEADPSSIAFAQLAEEYRRGGNYEAAEQCCRTGLTRHPGYLSARVTLGRTLIELDKLEEAEQELNFVLKSAPDNLAAIRGMAEIHQRRGNLEGALDFFRRALPLARHDPEIEETVKQINRDLGGAKPAEKAPGLSFKEAQDEFLSALNRLPQAPAPKRPETIARDPHPVVAPPPPPPPPPPEPEPEPDPEPAPEPVLEVKLADVEPAPVESGASIDFDSLLKSLGAADHPAPPMVDALLREPSLPDARPEPILPDLPVAPEAEDPFADLERGLRALDQPPPAARNEMASVDEPGPPPDAPAAEPLGYGEVSFDTAPAYHEAPAEPVVPYGERIVDDPPPDPAPAAEPEPVGEPAPVAVPEPVLGPIEVRATIELPEPAPGEPPPEQPSSSATDEDAEAREQFILDELEAWLSAIKR